MSTAASSPGVSRYRHFRANLLTPQRIRELGVIRTNRALLDIAFCWILILAAFVLVTYHTAWWSLVTAFVLIGNRYYALFIIGHDGMHRRVAPSTNRNDLICDLLVFGPIGAITRLNNYNHLEHHYWLGTPKDPDRPKHCSFNKTSSSELLGFLSGFSIVLTAIRNVFHPRARQNQAGGYGVRDVFIVGGWFVLLAGGLTWQIGWWAYPLLWLAPVYTFMYLADNFRSWSEHSHPEADDSADAHRLITFLSNPVERCFLAPMNMNYHTVHHLWPSIPYYNLAAADREIRTMPAARGLEWRGSYLAYLWTYMKALPLAEYRRSGATL